MTKKCFFNAYSYYKEWQKRKILSRELFSNNSCKEYKKRSSLELALKC